MKYFKVFNNANDIYLTRSTNLQVLALIIAIYVKYHFKTVSILAMLPTFYSNMLNLQYKSLIIVVCKGPFINCRVGGQQVAMSQCQNILDPHQGLKKMFTPPPSLKG